MIRRRANVSRRCAMALVAIAVGAALLAGCTRPSTYRFETSHPNIDAASLRAIELKVKGAVREGLYPGGVVSVRAGTPQLERAVGVADPATGERVSRGTFFDVASLTKPVLTATLASVLVTEGHVRWDDRVLDTATVDELLRHEALMPANFDWRKLGAAATPGTGWTSTVELCNRVLATQPPSSFHREYSNAGYFVLYAYLIDHQPDLESLREYRALLNMLYLASVPYGGGRVPSPARTAPDVEPGTLFDPLAAWAIDAGHPSGHSGLFATAGDIDRWAGDAMSPTSTWGPALFDRASPTATRSRAFEVVPRRDGSGVAFRHTGYTGCVLWLDPERQLSLVLLTNRGGGASAAWERHVSGLINELERGWQE